MRAGELLASKFLSVIGKTTDDNALKKKIEEGRHVGGSNYRRNTRVFIREND